jgi:predicted nucleotidyltransferase
MFDDCSKYKVLEVFFREPTEKHQIRGISRKVNLANPSVKNYLEELKDEDLIRKVDEGVYPGYKASMNEKFKEYKQLNTVRKLRKIGLVDKLESESHPNAIVLYGSAVNGEDTEQSDIDILVVAKEKQIDLDKYEEEMNRDISLNFKTEEEIVESKEFANSLANGIVLQGFLKVK